MFAKKGTLTSIQKRSEAIFNVFTQTKNDAEALNAEIVTVVAGKREEAKKILDEVTELEAVATKNANLAKKIDAFLNS